MCTCVWLCAASDWIEYDLVGYIVVAGELNVFFQYNDIAYVCYCSVQLNIWTYRHSAGLFWRNVKNIKQPVAAEYFKCTVEILQSKCKY